MPKKLEARFQQEVLRRTQQKGKGSGQKVKVFLLLVVVVAGFVYLFRQCSSVPVNPIASEIATPKNKPTPIALPQTGVLKQGTSTTDEFLGRLRFFLRTPLPDEKSSLPTTCSAPRNSEAIGNTNHYFVQLLDWQTDKVIATAFIRSGEMVEMLVPFGVYKLRYAVGSEWYGEKEMFGSEEMYEMTEALSFTTAKFEFSIEKPGSDVGAYCANGNLGKKRVKKNP